LCATLNERVKSRPTQKKGKNKMVTTKTAKAVKVEAIAPSTPASSTPPSSTSADSSTPAPNGVTKAVFGFMDVCEAVYFTGKQTGNIYRAEGARPAIVHAVSAATGAVVDIGKQAVDVAPGVAKAVQNNAPVVATEATKMATLTVELTQAAQAKAASLLAGR
jgi:hypothetical protein